MKSLDREDQWNALLANIRIEYHRRSRFKEVFDQPDDLTILQSRKSRGKPR